jgi:ribosomal subunit interface protein
VEVVFDASQGSVKVEMIVNAEHRNMFIANHDQGDAYASIDGCVHKLERQLSEHKDMYRNRKHPEVSKPAIQP